MGETRLLGDYAIIKQIGQGALGAVYLAEHRFMKRQYVLKILPEELSTDRSFVQRLEEEISILASLDHPNIVKIHNISFAQGQYFLVTDCIVDALGETTNLGQFLLSKTVPLEEQEIYNFLCQVAEALNYAHQKNFSGKGIAHRGIKLNNILIGKGKNGDTELYLSDFGLSRIVGTAAILTKTYQTVAELLGLGSFVSQSKNQRNSSSATDSAKLAPLHQSFLQGFSFLSPEQKKIELSASVDIKADIYAFGVLTYYLLMHEFPEGVFEMPSEKYSDSIYNWNKLIVSCLQNDPRKRPEHILNVLESIIKSKNSVANSELTNTPNDAQKVVNQDLASTNELKPLIRKTQIERPTTDMDPSAAFQVDSAIKYYVPERKEVKNSQPIFTDMGVIRGGTFYRGSTEGNRDEMPQHPITLDSYAIDIHPVTNDQFARFLEVMGGEKDSNHQDIIRLRDSRIKRTGGRITIESGYAKHPVVGVTWYGAIAYAKWIGKRLPTEAEWEIASIGGRDENLYPTGDDIEKSQANFFSSDTTPVMSYAANGYGLYDMAGNVYEWCQDWYGYNYYEISMQEPENPKGPLQGVYRVLRGGCWKSLKEDLRCSHRHRNNPGAVNGTYGFRCAADVQ